MKLNIEKLINISNLSKLFFDQTTIDTKLKYVYFFPGLVFARNSFGGLIYLDGFEEVEESFAIPFDIFTKLDAFCGKYKDVVVSFGDDKSMTWRFGRTRYSVSSIDIEVESINLFLPKDESNPIKLSIDLKELTNKAEFCASKDTRQPNLYGIQLNSDKVASCDNMRAYLQNVDKGFSYEGSLFLTRELMSILSSIPENPDSIIFEENRMFFVYDKFLIFTALPAFSCPDISGIFNKVNSSDKKLLVTDFVDSRESFQKLITLFKGKFSSALKIVIKDNKVFYEVGSDTKSETISGEFDVSYSGEEKEFAVNSSYFFEALMRFSKFYIMENMLFFEEDGEFHALLLIK